MMMMMMMIMIIIIDGKGIINSVDRHTLIES